jgi:RHH-type proline utilization regulon transcriptional repressor/proline dehydrogenase/delta 1-pyrroline-5-carboxylate dehydrogenase
VIETPRGKLEWALTTLEEGESWLVAPELIEGSADADAALAGRLWRPGIRVGVRPGSRTHLEEFFGPMLGIMHASSLSEAVELQNAVAYGLTAGLYTQDPADLELWLDQVEAGNLYVNRGITGAIVQRQPFGGWKRSSVGAGTTAGPNYLIGLGSWRPRRGAPSSTLHLRGLDGRITRSSSPPSRRWTTRPSSGCVAGRCRRRRLGPRVRPRQGRVAARRGAEPLPVPARRGRGARDEGCRVAGPAARGRRRRAGGAMTISAPVGLPAGVRRALGDLDVAVFVESDEQWIERLQVARRRRDAARAAGRALGIRCGHPRRTRHRDRG